MNFGFEKKKNTSKLKVLLLSVVLLYTFSVNGQVNCPPNITVFSEPGLCGAMVNVPRPCTEAPNHTGFYQVGVHDVVSICGATRCTTRITVMDGQGPVFPNCVNRTIQLLDGQCGPNIFELLNPIDNCDAFGALRFAATNGNPYPINHEFKPGTYNLSYSVTDRSNNTSNCSFVLTVIGIPSRTTAIACTKNLNISLDSNCMAIITPKILLEGGPYGCYEDYKVQIFDELNRPVGDTLRAQNVGKTIKAEVTSPEGNKCWTNVTVEDKEPPVLNCKPIYTTCGSNTTPGAALPLLVPYKAHLTNSNKFITSISTTTKPMPIQVFGLTAGSITDIDVYIRVKHTNV
ncbi:MAG TPA: hypothetical protein PKD85_15905 [Saprospiraceae bacterium]|nr:hypothetical protein [Saprospiraceae bacterium]